MQCALMLSISAAVITWAASAVADSPNVKGDYGFTGTNSCIHAAGFTGVNGGFVATSSGAFESAAVEGIQSFNGDGTGTVTGSGLLSRSIMARMASSASTAARRLTIVTSERVTVGRCTSSSVRFKVRIISRRPRSLVSWLARSARSGDEAGFAPSARSRVSALRRAATDIRSRSELGRAPSKSWFWNLLALSIVGIFTLLGSLPN